MRLFLACLIGKICILALRFLGKRGTTWPGHLSLKIDSHLIDKLEGRLSDGSVLITGTNGKTTTAHMTAYLLKGSGFNTIHNAASANLLNGLASSLILSTKFRGIYPHYGGKSLGIFEVDEAVLVKAVEEFTPEVLVLLNLSRDQLDRYGEIDLLVQQWRQALESLKKRGAFPKVVYCKEDKHLQRVVRGFPCDRLYPISGRAEFSQTNAHFAAKAASLFGVSVRKSASSLRSFKPVFGRGERLAWREGNFHLFLAKNPKSFDENLKHWIPRARAGTAFWLVLNDNIPDGRDISWIWDIDSSLLARLLKDKAVFVSGKRASDLAIRLKYAGLDPASLTVEPRLKKAAARAALEKEVVVFPTYSAMLEVRKILTGDRFSI